MKISSGIPVREWVRRVLYGAAAVLGCTQAPAQEQTQPVLQEVTVTAERREEKLQDVPIAVTAFNADQLRSRQLNDIHALTALTPSVNLDSASPFSGDKSVLSASIRGIGQDDFAFNLNPGVGVYLDGVFLARTIGSNLNLLDVDRVEILKGPQGTLFGANTIGGAISIVTHTPGDTPRFIATVTGGKYNRRDVGFTADIPITDNLLSSITVSSQNQTGWARTIPYPTSSPWGQSPFVVDPDTAFPKAGYQTSDNWGGTGVTSIRGKMLWKASDKLNVTFTADWTHQDQTALNYTILNTYFGNLNYSTFSTMWNLCISNNAATLPGQIAAHGGAPPPGTPGVPPAVTAVNTLFAGLCSQPRAHVPGLSIGGAPLLGAGYVGGPAGPYNINNHPGGPYLGTNQPRIWWELPATQTGDIDTTYSTGPNFARNDVFGGSVTGVYNLSDNLDLKSITGYRQIKWNIGTDLDGTPETFQEVTDAQHQWQVSQEFQLLGKALDNNLNYVAGLYYFKERGYVHDFVPFESILYVYDVQNDVTNTDYAAFLNLDYRLGNWGFTAGGRYTHVKTDFVGGQSDLNSFPFGSFCWQNSCGGAPPFTDIIPNAAPPGSPFLRYFPGVPDSQSWDIFDPKLGIQYHFSPDVMAYASWAKGFKQGGWTTRLQAGIDSPEKARFSPEYAETYELGLKSEWLNHRLLTNAAVYYTNYDGIQLNIQQGISPVYTNAGNAKIKGAELELQWLVGGGLQLNLSGSYIDAYYTFVNAYANIPQSLNPDGSNNCPATGTVLQPPPPHPACAFQPEGVTQLDAKLPKTPKWKGTIWPSYDYVLPSQATLRLLAAFTYTAEMWNDALNTPELRRPASRQLDASLHYISSGGKYDLAFGGTNLTDDRYCTAGSPNVGAGEVGCYYNAPRMWYVTLRAEFGGK
ncbi:MAG TPA: TonB-dependent receptor [Steroidobacteraceae bacterium]|nr:TonB-dependent receptor [Steroidobacteraceae bacterium]